jgi:hypothetical protein
MDFSFSSSIFYILLQQQLSV